MRLFTTKPFARFARRAGIGDGDLRVAIERAEAGRVDADLGGGVVKLRLARPGHGKSGGFRTIVLFRRGAKAIFVYGFAKSDRDNIGGDELTAFRALARHMLALGEADLVAAIESGTITEITHHG
jgi:hypothetical protein